MPFAIDTITGLITSIIYDTAKGGYRSVIMAVDRRSAISQALASPGNQPPIQGQAKSAIDDVVKVIAHTNGQYTDNVANFLNELRRSGVPDALRDLAICGHSPENAFEAFDLIYRSFDQLPFTSEALFSAIFAAIKHRFEEGIKDPGMLEALRKHTASLSEQMEQLSRSLGTCRSVRTPMNSSALHAARVRIAKAIEISNDKIAVETNEGQKKVPISELVIPARLRPTDALAPDTPTTRAIGEPALHYIQFRRAVQKAVILGDPGGGKSTLTQLLCHTLAKQISLEDAAPNHPQIDPRDLRLPIKIVLRNLEKRQQKTPSYTILDYIEDDFRGFFENNIDQTRLFIVQLLSIGGAILLFDGLDEILNVNSRREIVNMVQDFCVTYASCPAFVTSRVVGYRDAPLIPEFGAYVLSRFNKDEVTKFSTNMIREIQRIPEADASDRAARFVQQTERVADDLRENPLMLGLMVFLYIYKGDVPDNRPQIYRECSILMFQKWDANRGIEFGIAGDFKLMDLFSFLASRIFGNAETEEGVSRSWLNKEILEYFSSWYADRPRALAVSNKIVEFITGRAWVMCDAGPGVYKFTHRTFLEYFFARRIEGEAESISDLLKGKLYPHILRAEWDVVNHLALQIATFENGPKTIKAADAIRELLRDHVLVGPQKMNLLSFVSRSLEYLSVPEGQLAEIVQEIFAQATASGASGDMSAMRVIEVLLYYTKKRDRVVVPLIYALCLDIIRNSRKNDRAFVIYLIGQKETYYRLRIGRGAFTGGLIWETFASLRSQLERDLSYQIDSSPIEARRAVYLYGRGFAAAYRKHGLAFLDGGMRAAPAEIQCPGLVGVRSGTLFLNKEEGDSIYDYRDSHEFAMLFADDVLSGKLRSPPFHKPSPDAHREIEELLMGLIEWLYDLSRSTGRRRPLTTLSKYCACLFALIEMIELRDKNAEGAAPLQRLFLLAPEDAMRNIVHELRGTEAGSALVAWIDGRRNFIDFSMTHLAA